MEIIATIMSMIITHLIRPMDAFISPRITENPSSNATIKIIIPSKIRIDILCLFDVFKTI